MEVKLTASRWIALVALAVCAALLTEHFVANPTFCSFRSGCDDVLFSAYGRPLGVPLPAIGAAAFGGFLTLTLVGASASWIGAAARLAGMAGLILVIVQFIVLRQICVLCLLVDGCAIGLAVLWWRSKPSLVDSDGSSRAARWAWLTLSLSASLAPLSWAWLRPVAPIPDQVRALWTPGAITLVEVTDFDCAHCRQAHAVVDAFRRQSAGSIRFVQLPAAMPSHAEARPAARAYLAAQAQGKGDEMASALFAAARRGPDDCRQLAQALELDMAAYDRIATDPATDAEIDATNSWAMSAGPGLPLLWLQDQFFYGVPAPDTLRRAWRRSFTGITAHVHQIDTNDH
jgi:uncharacterized membrane protein/2-hydroxychromene-2-carboxylate isomerase